VGRSPAEKLDLRLNRIQQRIRQAYQLPLQFPLSENRFSATINGTGAAGIADPASATPRTEAGRIGAAK